MSGEVFGGAENLRVPESPQRLPPQGGNGLRVSAEAPHPDHRIFQVAVDIQHRSQHKVDPHAPQLPPGPESRVVDRLWGSQCGQGHGRGHLPHLLRQAGDHAALLVGGNQRRQAGFRLDFLPQAAAQRGQLALLPLVVLKQDHIADLLLPHQPEKFPIRLRAGQAGQNQLSQFLVQRHVR